MRKTRVALISIAVLVLAIVCATVGAGAWLLYTEAGLAWLSTRAVAIAGEGLTIDGVAGTLAHGMKAQRIRYAGDDLEVRVSDAFVQVDPWSFLRLRPRIVSLRASELAVVTKPTEPRGRPPDTLELPVSFALSDARVERLVIDLGKGPIELTNVGLDYAGGRDVHRIEKLVLSAYGQDVELTGTIDAQPPFALQANAAVVRHPSPQASLNVGASGTLSALTLEGAVQSGEATASFQGSVEPYAPHPLAALKAQVEHVDVKAFVKAAPHTMLAGEVELERSGALLIGPVRLTNSAHGPYDKGRVPVAALRVDVRTDMKDVRTFDLAANLGRGGAISGSGSLVGEIAHLKLRTGNLDLSGLHSRLRKTHLAGHADLTLSETHQSVTADVAQDQIALAFAAQHSGDHVDVSRFRARARGGEATGKARIALSGRRAFAADAAFSRFDPSAWGDFPPGSINGTVAAKGLAEGPEADVELAIRDSRWLDAPLIARGTFSLRGERLQQADVTASIGGNDISARGTLGTRADTLSVKFDAPKLGVFSKDVQGSARGTAQLSGSWRSPAVRFDVTGSGLGYQKIVQLKGLQARGEVATESGGPFTVDATLRGIVIPEWQLDAATLRARGTPGAHTLTVTAKGDRVDFQSRASGGWKAQAGWSGKIEELVNKGEVAVALTAPVAVTLGPQRVHADAFELKIMDGQFLVNALDYRKGRLNTAGKFTALPVRPLLAVAGGPAAMAGTLRLNGSWSLENLPHLSGRVTIDRESGDLALGTPLQLGLQTLSLDARFEPRGIAFQAAVRSALATATAEGRVSPAGGAQGTQYSAASAIVFKADMDVKRLAPFAAFIDTTMLLDGSAQARLEGSGTLGNPQVTGPITADGIAVALPADGIELKDGTLRASLARNEIRVDSFSIRGGEGTLTGSGTLARAGFDEASVDWSAQNFTVLARPDRRLVVAGKGNAALRRGQLVFNGAVRAIEGLFELSTASLPQLGDDVVIVGREEPVLAEAESRRTETRGKKPTKAVVDLSIDLGQNVHLRGRGLDVWLSGALRVQTTPQGELRGVGTIDARRGLFTAYGQRLEIDRGTLYFNGPLNNPGLDFLALRKRQAVEAGVAVTGTLSQPLVRVVSVPAVPEGEALSWLILGRAPSQAGAGQLSAVPLATGAILGKAGAPLARALNLDEVGVRSGNEVSQQFVTLGKRISDRVYIAFEQSIGGTESLLRLEMTLTERTTLRAETGRASSLGLFYRYAWD
jgi:translocation and assembly module TamB